jgi:hypothetical protein
MNISFIYTNSNLVEKKILFKPLGIQVHFHEFFYEQLILHYESLKKNNHHLKISTLCAHTTQ